jgi:hypothetical protein
MGIPLSKNTTISFRQKAHSPQLKAQSLLYFPLAQAALVLSN